MHTAILLITIHLISFGYALNCGGTNCPSTDYCCNDLASGYRCYNPSNYHCVANDLNQTVLCPVKLQACGTACYNASLFECASGEVLCGITSAGTTIKSCAGKCYNPANLQCCHGYLSAKSASTVCAPRKANATALFCSPFNQIACDAGQWCCEGVCYDPTKQTCFDNQLCPVGNRVCGTTCYDPTSQECCNLGVYPSGTSVCSTAHATCCSCSCTSTAITGISSQYTVSAPGQCNAAYIKSQFSGSQLLQCPSSTWQSCSSSTENCESTINCGSNEFFLERCYGYNSSCEGTYLCGGGSFQCHIQSRSSCPAQTSNQYESGHNVTLVGSGSTSYEYVPPNYAGKVCCWCANGSETTATSAPVPSVNDCNAAYMYANDYYTEPNASCIVWSRDLFDTKHLDCGLPQE